MARQPQLIQEFARDIVEVTVGEEMSESFLAYSLSVITSRAIPDVRDGLKPVQRRILYSMREMGLTPDRPHRKSARVVGDTMGRYHPHGDGAIYETLVRMAQGFARGITFVDPQGNFGTLDDPPAAQRYTECRLSDAALAMVGELDEDTVEMRATYDGEGEEPVYLPALVPNLLVNGTTGIAVGMATNMPTHNLREVRDAIALVLTKRRPRPTTDELLAVLPGPDFPSGGMLIDEGIREAYETGRGSLRMRAKAEVERVGRNRDGIIVTELPYLVGPERVIAKIKELVNDGKLAGIADVKNLSDRHQGLRLQIECKPGFNPHGVLADLYRMTPLEETFGVNNVVLVDGVPTTVGIHELCQHYITHRLDIIVRRTQYRLGKARDRLHLVEGRLIALDALDTVIDIIRTSADTPEARERLCSTLGLSVVQANDILEMRLRMLTTLEVQKLIDERDELVARIADLEGLLGSETRQRKTVLTELDEVTKQFGVERRTRIVSAEELPVYEATAPPAEDVPDEPCVITLSSSGVVGRSPRDGAKRATPGRHDVLAATTLSSMHASVWAITSEGRALRVSGAEVPEVAGRSRGGDAGPLFGLNRGERALTVVTPGEENLVLVTAQGVVKRLAPAELEGTKPGRTVLSLRDGDRLVAVFPAPEGVDVVLVADDAQVLRTPVDGISVQGRGAGGVAGMALKGSTIIGAGPAIGDTAIVSVTTAGLAKATPADEIPTKGRGGGGVRLTKLGDGQRLTQAHVGPLADLACIMGSDDNPAQPDPNPVAFPLEPTRRDLVSQPTERPILSMGPARWWA